MRQLLDRGGVILTANARAARALHLRYAESRLTEGVVAWLTPQIIDLHSWLSEQWKSLLLTGTEDRVLLNELQELVLWQRIMTPTLADRTLIEPAHMAKLAQEAYSLLATHNALARVNDPLWMAEQSAEPEVFRQWARSFQQECTRHRWIARCELTEAVTYALRFGAMAPPKEMGWLGFDRPTPAEQGLQAALIARGTTQQMLAWRMEQRVLPALYAAKNDKDETIACATWVRNRLEANPKARIGILLPDLANRRSQLERDLSTLLNPQQFAITAGAAPALSFEFSLGQPLAQVPLIHAALLLLRWLRQPLTQQEVSWLLLSSTLGAAQGDASRDALAHLDTKLRNARCAPPEITLEAFLHRPQTGVLAARSLHHNLTAMLQEHRRAARRATAGQWVRHITSLLLTARWSDHSNRSSLLFQGRETWDRMLDNVASLDFANSLFSYQDFLKTLERAAQEMIFAPESEDAPVQVMGAYAASGQSFDCAWFLGATDTAWPTCSRPNPLLPIALQREFGMPHASAADDHAVARRAMERIVEGCGEIVCSYAQMSDDALQRPSALVSDFAPAEIASEAETSVPIPLETVGDDHWIPFTHTAVVPGGHMPLKRQADCPFQAFIFHRLHARELAIAGRGLSPGDRGTLVHKIVEGIWSKDLGGYTHLTSQADLHRATSAGTLRPLVAEHAAAAIRSIGAENTERWQRAYLKAEEERAIDLVMDWLAVECARQPFEVLTVEEKATIQVGDLALNVRADRIDRIPGGKLLVDYKTGEVSTASWEGARPEQPQLPLYAAFGDAKGLIGAVFAQVRWPKPQFKGRVSNARANLSDVLDAKDPLVAAPYTEDVVEEWRGTLLNLAESFVRGEARVDPHVYPKSCQYCPLAGVCRVAECRGTPVRGDSVEEEEAE